nr:RHS repeat-associated core domain-containing protein [Flavobacterium sp.]
MISSNGYDEKGRTLNNDQTGTTTFKNDKIYQAASQQLNAAGIENFSNDIPQIITYNENNDPVYIDGQKGDAFFSYGLTEMRQSVTYGGNFNPEQGQQGKFTKYYSEDGSYEITTDNTTGQEKHILYLEGSPYESDILFVKNYSDAAAKYLFLHKDYIGSILAITDEAGTAVEQRHFDAWGNLSLYATANGLAMPSTVAGSMLIDRGYTSHEHFAELGIIHMNGRLYDTLQRRFLNADENIQDPNNTQCYNKYGYAMNNPLLYNDPSGEIIPALVVAIIIGAAVGVASYAIGSYFTYGSWEKVGLSGALKAAFWGAVSGAVTFGIGECFTTGTGVLKAATAFSKTFGGVLVKAAAHGISQGTLAMMQNNGAGFLSGASGGFFGSLGATAWGGAGGKWGGIGGKYASTTVGTIAFGSLSGGVGAELSGGNFWQGAVTGGIVAGLNEAMHKGFAKKYKLHVLEDYEGANGAGHQALVGDVDGDLFYVSKDGTNENNGVYGEVKNTIKTFDSFEAIDDYYSTKVSPGKHYDSKLTFKVTKAQMQTALKTAIRWAKMPYNLMNNSCTTIVQVGLINAGILNIKNFDMIPNQSFKVMSQIKYKPAY